MAVTQASSKVIGLGAGGHAKVLIEILQAMGTVEITGGLLDVDPMLWKTRQLGISVPESDELLPKLFDDGIRQVFIGVGSTGESSLRRNLFEKAQHLGFVAIPCIHPGAVISPSATFGEGPNVMGGAVVNSAARIGANVIVNPGAIVEHDCLLEEHSHVALGARLGSAVTVGKSAHVGIGACVRQCIRIGRNSVVGAGAAVVSDVPDDTVVVGVPARPLRKVKA